MSETEPSWDLYRSFRAVADTGSLSGAARVLGVTQPTIARHVEALEALLGRRLFTRSQRGLAPTEAGEAIRPYAEALAATSAALLRAAAGEVDVAGTVRITASEMVGVERLPPIVAAIRRRHPRLALELAASNAVENLLRRDADIAVRMVPPAQEALVARKIGVVRLGLFARADYLEAHTMPRRPEDLGELDLIGFARETPALQQLLSDYPFLQHARFAFRSDSDLAQLAALRAGFGVGVCQTGIAARDPRLVRLLPNAFAPELPVWIVMHEDLRGTPRCRAVYDALVEGLAREVD
ncbi:MAG: LysR family transcriptional regulator [Amaricoccus sp.]